MPEDKQKMRIQADILRIVAAKGASRIIEYSVREYLEPGSIPNWFPGVILLLRDEIKDDEKIVIQHGVIKIAKKNSIDKFIDWVRSLRRSGGEIDAGVMHEGRLRLRH